MRRHNGLVIGLLEVILAYALDGHHNGFMTGHSEELLRSSQKPLQHERVMGANLDSLVSRQMEHQDGTRDRDQSFCLPS
jgi:hypothetical protein